MSRVSLGLDRQCHFAGFPVPVPEYAFARAQGRRWRFDWAFPLAKLAIEQEGGAWTGGRHIRGKGYIGDMEKYNAATLAGWRILRFTPQQIADGTALNAIGLALEVTWPATK
jgi:hypothetical protein